MKLAWKTHLVDKISFLWKLDKNRAKFRVIKTNFLLTIDDNAFPTYSQKDILPSMVRLEQYTGAPCHEL